MHVCVCVRVCLPNWIDCAKGERLLRSYFGCSSPPTPSPSPCTFSSACHPLLLLLLCNAEVSIDVLYAPAGRQRFLRKPPFRPSLKSRQHFYAYAPTHHTLGTFIKFRNCAKKNATKFVHRMPGPQLGMCRVCGVKGLPPAKHDNGTWLVRLICCCWFWIYVYMCVAYS